MNTKNNKRFKNTEIIMEACTLELMKKHNIEKITVKKVCEKAGVNRSTFYAHFSDIYDLFDKMEDTLSKELLSKFDADSKIFSIETLTIFLSHIKKHKYFYNIVLPTRTDFPTDRGYDLLLNEVIRPLCAKSNITDENEILYYLISFQAGFTNILKEWVKNDCRQSEEKIAMIIKNCIPIVLHNIG